METKKQTRYTNEEILLALQKHSNGIFAPTVAEWQKNNYKPSAITIVKRFKTWNNAVIAAGLRERCCYYERREKDYTSTKKQILNYIQQKGCFIIQKKWHSAKDKPCSLELVKKLFGTYNNAFKEAGFPKKKETTISKEELLAFFSVYEKRIPIHRVKGFGTHFSQYDIRVHFKKTDLLWETLGVFEKRVFPPKKTDEQLRFINNPMFKMLSPREQKIFILRGQGMKIREIAEKMSVSKQRVFQIQQIAIKKMEKLERDFFDEPRN